MFQSFSKFFYVTFVVFNSIYSASNAHGYLNDKCLTPHGVTGICKNIRQCEPLLNVLIKSKSRPQPWVFDLLRRSHCGFKGKDPVVCCPIAIREKDKHESLNLTIKNPLYEKFLNKSCGSIQIADKVIGGSETTVHEFPWMARIGYNTIYGLDFRCGGSLISHNYVLTVAHCVTALTDIYPILVRLGEHDYEKSKRCEDHKKCTPSAKDIAIEELIPHPDFSKSQIQNDIALIRLAKSVEFQHSIQPICLPIHNNINERSLQNEKATVTGWGKTESGTTSSVLRKVTISIIPLKECSKAYTKVPITEAQICAGGQAHRDSCTGDSGGPLQIMKVNPSGEPAWIQYGIVSFGSVPCGTKGKPGVYTKVTHYMEWILDNIKE